MGPSSAPTSEVIPVARCAALSACRARRRSGGFSLKWAFIRVSTCACHHFCFVQAASVSSGSMEAADSGLLSDIRALYLAPRVVLAPLRRGGKKHEAQARARLREQIEQWPALPQQPEPTANPKKRKAQPVPDNVLDPKKEQLVEQAIRDKALSEACMLLTSSDSPITVDVPTEMKKLHPSEGEPCDLDYIPGRQLNFSSSDVESKLKEFPPGSSGGPSGWRGSHLKEMLTAKCKPSFLSALAAFCTRIANGSPTKARR